LKEVGPNGLCCMDPLLVAGERMATHIAKPLPSLVVVKAATVRELLQKLGLWEARTDYVTYIIHI
jgi:hypothetical protein